MCVTLPDQTLWQDFDSPDVYETHSPSPTRRSRMLPRDGRDRAAQSSDEDSDEEGNGDSDSGGAPTRRGAKKVGGQHGLPGGAQNPDIVDTKLDPDEAARRFKEATGVDGRGVGECGPSGQVESMLND